MTSARSCRRPCKTGIRYDSAGVRRRLCSPPKRVLVVVFALAWDDVLRSREPLVPRECLFCPALPLRTSREVETEVIGLATTSGPQPSIARREPNLYILHVVAHGRTLVRFTRRGSSFTCALPLPRPLRGYRFGIAGLSSSRLRLSALCGSSSI